MKGVLFAVIATIIWSGNFIVARAVIKDVPPISLAFFRWLLATIILLPFAFRQLRTEWDVVGNNWKYFLFIAFTGITLFNTFVYVAGHYSPAINLALIGTTSSPIMAIMLSAIFLQEKIPWQRVAGLLLCITGILLLLSRGDLRNLYQLQFGKGDGYVLLGAFAFAIYNVLVRKKPAGIGPLSFLLLIFGLGTILLIPGLVWEINHEPPIHWSASIIGVMVYLGAGTSVIAYLCWNAAISRLGTSRTALFGNLIPLFASLEALWLLQEKFTMLHLVCSVVIIIGLVLANLTTRRT
ncbi:DMT family transporter [Flavihumibacter petaseus]|uniref:Putative DMT family transporter n=1 Tax=Flavihumibacter petaseus NBRC 106054 TaxID=1220578 RepID=A0A0E9N3S8_9BACT|nr:DMT family transporter [Flavihumibacter petaseus]GAO44469.1 putative DMT family transporter [Flavihumibacter petaseus NBRC 106054]